MFHERPASPEPSVPSRGGTASGFLCVGGTACAEGVDDLAYVDDLLAEVRRVITVDVERVYATGISNGASMSHRLACDRADVLAAIAAVGGAYQADAAPGCSPSAAIAVMQVHGTDDPCWGFDGSIANPVCSAGGEEGRFVAVEPTMENWRSRNGCMGTATTDLPDLVDDGTTTVREDGVGCAAETVLLRIVGGGHTWPGGWQYLPERQIGRVSLDVAGNDVIWAFFAAQRRVTP